MKKWVKNFIIVLLCLVFIGMFLYFMHMPRVAWSLTNDHPIKHLVLRNNSLFFLDGDTFFAINAMNGKMIWSRKSLNLFTLSSTTVYAYSKNNDLLYAIKSSNGEEIWRINIGAVHQITATEEAVYSLLKNKNGVILRALALDKGDEIWRTELKTFDKGNFILAENEGVIVLILGKNLWILDIETGNQLWKKWYCLDLFNRPVVYKQRLYFKSDPEFYVLDIKDGTVISKAQASDDPFTEAHCFDFIEVFEKSIFCSCKRLERLYAIDQLTFEVRWECDVEGSLVDDAFLFSNGDIYMATEKSAKKGPYYKCWYIWSINMFDGHSNWFLRVKKRQRVSSNLLVRKNLIYFGTSRGTPRLYAYKEPLLKFGFR